MQVDPGEQAISGRSLILELVDPGLVIDALVAAIIMGPWAYTPSKPFAVGYFKHQSSHL